MIEEARALSRIRLRESTGANRRARVWCRILLGAVIAFSLVNTILWLWIDTRPPRWDDAHYLTMSLKYHEALLSGGAMSFLGSLLTVDPMRPPLVPLLAVPAYLVLGRSADVALTVNLLALVVLILATYGLGTRLTSAWCGLLAAVFVSACPGVLALSRVFYFDLADTALVAASLYLLVLSDAFSRKGPTVLCGLAMGLGLLCRAFFPVFMIGPWGVSAYAAWSGRRQSQSPQEPETSRWWVGCVVSLLVAVAVAAPWYVSNMIPLARRSLSAAYGAEAVGYGPENPLTLYAIMDYFNTVANWVGGALLCASATVIFSRNRSRITTGTSATGLKPSYAFLTLLSSICLPFIVFATFRAQDGKNIVPIVSAVAVASAWGLSLLRRSRLKTALIGMFVAWSLFQLWIWTYTYGLPVLPQTAVARATILDKLVPFIFRQAPFTLGLPRRENWKIPDILSSIVDGSGGLHGVRMMARPTIIAVVVPDHELFNQNNFSYFAALGRLPVRVEHPGDPRSPQGNDFKADLLRADFAVVKTGSPGPALLNPHSDEMAQFLRLPESGFVEIPPRFLLPDGSEAILYAASGRPSGSDVLRIRSSARQIRP